MTLHPPKKFKALQDEWYEKLKDAGFKDIEQQQIVGGSILRNSAMNNVASNYDQNSFSDRQEYFRLVGHFLYEHVFADVREKRIWELHAEGNTINAIRDVLKSEGFRFHKRSMVHNIIKDLSKKMLKKNNL